MCEALTGFDSCWAVSRNEFSKLDYYRPTHTTGEQARPYGCVRNGYGGKFCGDMGRYQPNTQYPYRVKPNVGAGLPARKRCAYIFPD